MQSLPTRPSFDRRNFQHLLKRGGFAELVYTLVGVNPRLALSHSGSSFDISGTQSEELRDSASVYVQDLEIEPM